MGKAETASREKNVSGAADSGESRAGGTRAVFFAVLLGIVPVRATNRDPGARFPRVAGIFIVAAMLAFAGGAIPVFAQEVSAASYRFHDGVALNDLTLTPGQVRTADEKQVCDQPPGWTGKFRKTSEALKKEVYAEYGVDKKKFNRVLFCTGAVKCDSARKWAKKNVGHKVPLPLYEVDHVDSLQLGGADVKENLMIQPYYAHPGAHEKDTVENWLHKQVCSGTMSLAQAQAKISTDWYQVYLDAHLGPAKKSESAYPNDGRQVRAALSER
jgi:hypothetical protein